MGILYPDVKMMCQARGSGASFRETATVGRLRLFLHPPELAAVRQLRETRQKGLAEQTLANYQFGDYADDFFREILGVETLETIDYSSYEGATFTHDMNVPIPRDRWGRFDAVVDAGSLEHIFNFPVAIGNLMRMVKVGGVVFITTVANNLCGHGFYQFSPELMYRIFSSENGFELRRVSLLEASFPAVELTPIRRAYEVMDPAQIGNRVGLVSDRPIMMEIEARKVSAAEPFMAAPQQSDYVATWNRDTGTSPRKVTARLKRIEQELPSIWRRKLRGYYGKWQNSLNNKHFYRKVA